MWYNVVFAVTMVTSVIGQYYIPDKGPCPRPPDKPNFDINKFYGLWYQHASFGSYNFGSYGRCATAHYKWDNYLESTVVNYTQIVTSTNRPETIMGYGLLVDPDSFQGAIWIVYRVPGSNVYRSDTVHIVGTDYHNWAVIYSCSDLATTPNGQSWILSRTPHLDQHPQKGIINAAINRTLRRINVQRSDYVNIDQQTFCPGRSTHRMSIQ